ncbi:MAG TPA: tetratricopeptide repeat protein [Vicinamibacteria bacterium]|nr:tetratricopeptide repeat protein [Vicinamibacteria bacterium]
MRLWLSALVVTQLLGSTEETATREGNELYREGKLDDALASYTKAQVDHPEAPELHYNIGNVHYRKEDTDKAIEEYRTVLQAGDELKRRAHYNIGNVHYKAQEWQEAVDAYKSALQIDPSDVEARQNLELALQKLNQQQQPQPDPQQQQDRTGEDEQPSRDQDSPDDPQDRGEENQNQPAPETQERGDDQSNAPPTPMEMSPEQAEQILQALAQMERSQQLELQQKQKAAAKGKGRYW